MKIGQSVLIGTTLLLPAPMFAQSPTSRAEIDADRTMSRKMTVDACQLRFAFAEHGFNVQRYTDADVTNAVMEAAGTARGAERIMSSDELFSRAFDLLRAT